MAAVAKAQLGSMRCSFSPEQRPLRNMMKKTQKKKKKKKKKKTPTKKNLSSIKQCIGLCWSRTILRSLFA